MNYHSFNRIPIIPNGSAMTETIDRKCKGKLQNYFENVPKIIWFASCAESLNR